MAFENSFVDDSSSKTGSVLSRKLKQEYSKRVIEYHAEQKALRAAEVAKKKKEKKKAAAA